jgi:hypothetical protein
MGTTAGLWVRGVAHYGGWAIDLAAPAVPWHDAAQRLIGVANMPLILIAAAVASAPEWRPHDATIASALPPEAMATCVQERMRKFGKVEIVEPAPDRIDLTFTFKPLDIPTIAKGRILFAIAAVEAGSSTSLRYTHPMDAKSVSKQAARITEACARPAGA